MWSKAFCLWLGPGFKPPTLTLDVKSNAQTTTTQRPRKLSEGEWAGLKISRR